MSKISFNQFNKLSELSKPIYPVYNRFDWRTKLILQNLKFARLIYSDLANNSPIKKFINKFEIFDEDHAISLVYIEYIPRTKCIVCQSQRKCECKARREPVYDKVTGAMKFFPIQTPFNELDTKIFNKLHKLVN